VGLGHHRIALVKRGVTVKLALCKVDVLVSAQHRNVKSAALHLHQLVDQHIARSAQFAFEAEPAAQQKGLAVRTAIGELGEVQVDAFNASQIQAAGIGVIREFKVI
jgi:hypothetical protein